MLECGDSRRRISIRPSGTEPKLKLYAGYEEVTSKDFQSIEIQTEELDNMLMEFQRNWKVLLRAGSMNLQTSLASIKGVGPKTVEQFSLSGL